MPDLLDNLLSRGWFSVFRHSFLPHQKRSDSEAIEARDEPAERYPHGQACRAISVCYLTPDPTQAPAACPPSLPASALNLNSPYNQNRPFSQVNSLLDRQVGTRLTRAVDFVLGFPGQSRHLKKARAVHITEPFIVDVKAFALRDVLLIKRAVPLFRTRACHLRPLALFKSSKVLAV